MPKTTKANRRATKSRPQTRKRRAQPIASAAETNGSEPAAQSRQTTKGPRTRAEKSLIPKDELAQEIAMIIRYHHLTQTEAARVVGDAPSQMSLLMAGKIGGFSTERLLKMLLRLGRDIELVFRPATNPRAAKFRISHKSELSALSL